MKANEDCLIYKNTVKDFKAYVDHHLGYTTGLKETVCSTLEVQILDKKKTIVHNGKIYTNYLWIQVGYGRFFKLETNSEGVTEDVTIDFCKPGRIIYVKEIFENELSKDFCFQLAAGAVIIPLENGCSSVLNLTELEAANLAAKVMASERPESLKRMEFLQLDPRERYKAFLKYFGTAIEQHFLVKQIACFLKMRPSFLSRLRREFVRMKAEVITYLQTVFFMVEFI